MFVDNDDKTIVIHPEAMTTIHKWLGTIELACHADPIATSQVRALMHILNRGFGPASRVTPDGDGLFVAEYPDRDTDRAAYVFGCVVHRDGQVGVHS